VGPVGENDPQRYAPGGGSLPADVAHDTGTVGAWDMADGFVQVTLQRESAAVDVACVAPPGGPVLAVTVNQRGQVEVGDVDTGETRHRFVAPAADPLPGTGSHRLPAKPRRWTRASRCAPSPRR